MASSSAQRRSFPWSFRCGVNNGELRSKEIEHQAEAKMNLVLAAGRWWESGDMPSEILRPEAFVACEIPDALLGRRLHPTGLEMEVAFTHVAYGQLVHLALDFSLFVRFPSRLWLLFLILFLLLQGVIRVWLRCVLCPLLALRPTCQLLFLPWRKRRMRMRMRMR